MAGISNCIGRSPGAAIEMRGGFPGFGGLARFAPHANL
jgi:hypothetical protein